MTADYLTDGSLDFSVTAVQELRRVLVDAYPRTNQVMDLVRQAKGDVGEINWDQGPTYVWGDTLRSLAHQGKLVALLEVVVAGPNNNVGLRVNELMADTPVVAAPAPAGTAVDASPASVTETGFEKLVEGQSTLLDIAFLQRGLELAPAVVRLLVTLDGARYFGTAFRIADRRFLSNHHVLFSKSGAPATTVEAWFGYENDFAGTTKAHVSLNGDVATINGDQTHDWAVVDLLGDIPSGVPIIPPVAPGRVVQPEDRVYIIQHPSGGPKKIGMVHNVVRSVSDDVVQYWTDTEQGSSGSPVFDEKWQLVALHHYWTKATPDGGGPEEIRNQGRRIERVAEGLAAAGLA